MRTSEFKKRLEETTALLFVQPNGTVVPLHFHVTEAGLTTKQFIDCGGVVRTEKKLTLQLWVAHDYEHRLNPVKLLGIIDTFEQQISKEDLDVEIEYQQDTIGRYGLNFDGMRFVLQPLQTDCLAPDRCSIPTTKQKVELAALGGSCCTPGGGCC